MVAATAGTHLDALPARHALDPFDCLIMRSRRIFHGTVIIVNTLPTWILCIELGGNIELGGSIKLFHFARHFHEAKDIMENQLRGRRSQCYPSLACQGE